MKFVIILLLALLPFTLTQSDGTCANHPQIDKIEGLIDSLESRLSAEDYSAITDAFAAYKQGDGDTEWVTALSDDELQCTGFSGDSCCSDDFIGNFKPILKAAMKNKSKKQKPIQKEFLKQFSKSLQKCAGRKVVKEFIEIEGVKDFLKDLKSCRKGNGKVGLNFLRRNLCTLCFSGEEMGTKFDADGKLLVTDGSLEVYESAMLSTFDCYTNLNQELFDAIETYYNSIKDDLTGGKKNSCENFTQWIDALLIDGPSSIMPTKPSQGGCKNKAKFMDNGCEDDLEGEGEFEEGGEKGPKTRMLQEESDYAVDNTNGYVVYKDESTVLKDSAIIDEAYTDETIEIEGTDDTNNGDDDGENSNKLTLFLASLFVACLALI